MKYLKKYQIFESSELEDAKQECEDILLYLQDDGFDISVKLISGGVLHIRISKKNTPFGVDYIREYLDRVTSHLKKYNLSCDKYTDVKTRYITDPGNFQTVGAYWLFEILYYPTKINESKVLESKNKLNEIKDSFLPLTDKGFIVDVRFHDVNLRKSNKFDFYDVDISSSKTFRGDSIVADLEFPINYLNSLNLELYSIMILCRSRYSENDYHKIEDYNHIQEINLLFKQI